MYGVDANTTDYNIKRDDVLTRPWNMYEKTGSKVSVTHDRLSESFL